MLQISRFFLPDLVWEVSRITITATQPKLQLKKVIEERQRADGRRQKAFIKKKQLSQHSTDIGTPQVPLRQLPVKQEHELLCDWENAS